MSTKMSNEDFMKKLKSSGVLSDDMLSKVTGGVSNGGLVPTSVPCPYCGNIEGNVVILMPGGGPNDGLAKCGNDCEPYPNNYFLIKGGVSVPIESGNNKIVIGKKVNKR